MKYHSIQNYITTFKMVFVQFKINVRIWLTDYEKKSYDVYVLTGW